jgi:hypothetical protein
MAQRYAIQFRKVGSNASELDQARALLDQWLLSSPPLRGARPVAATREFLACTPAQTAEPGRQFNEGYDAGERMARTALAPAQTAESTLAAVREAFDDAPPALMKYPFFEKVRDLLGTGGGSHEPR